MLCMAAGRRLRLKLKYSTRLTSSASSSARPHMNSNTMDIGSDIIMQSPTTNAPQLMSSPLPFDPNTRLPNRITIPLVPAMTDTARRRRLSKGGAGAGIKRSVSTPNIRKSTQRDSAMSLADKRRSKLGYHRTSVACVHCRRRKIRCLLAPDDPQNRCLNCIKLKKECNFYPVDQQPPVERRPRADSRLGGRSGETSASSSSSLQLVGGHIIEQVDNYGHYPPLPVITHAHDYPHSLAPLSSGILSPPASAAPCSARPFDFAHPPDRPNWEPHFFDHSHVPGSHHVHEDHAATYWKTPEAPMTPAFSPYSTGPTNSVPHQSPDISGGFVPYANSRQDSGWSLPSRSMSYGQVEDLSHHYQNSTANYHHQQQYQLDYRRRASELQPPSLQTSANSSNTSMSDPTNVPMQAPVTSQPMHHFNVPSAWQALPDNSPSRKSPEYVGWYPESNQLAKVQEEEIGPHFGGDPAMLYSSAGRR